MKKETGTYLKHLALFFISYALIAFGLGVWALHAVSCLEFSLACTYFLLLNLGGHLLFISALNKNPALFVRMFLTIVFVKLFLSFLTLAVTAFLLGKSALGLIVFFLVSYVFFLIFETMEMFRSAKKGSAASTQIRQNQMAGNNEKPQKS